MSNDARAKAIAAFNSVPAPQPAAPQAQTSPVQNPTSVSPEEVGALSQHTGETAPLEGQSTTNETDSPETTKAPKEDTLSSQYAVLARKEKALRAKVQAQEAAYKAKEDALRAREEAIAAKDAEYQSKYISRDRITQDPWNTLQELGLSYDQLTQLAVNPPPQQDPVTKAAIQKFQEEIKSLKDAQEKANKSYQDSQTQAYQQAVNQIRSEAKSLVSSDPNFETIKETNSVDDVVDLIEQTFKSEGVLLSVEEAAQAVEDHLIEEAMKIAKLKKIQQRLSPQTPAAPQKTPEGTNTKQPQQTLKTLTNSVGTSRQLTAKERAILAFKGELKN